MRRNILIAIVFFLAGAACTYLIFVRSASSTILSPIGKINEKPFEKYTILHLSSRKYSSSQIVLDAPTATTSAYTVYTFHFMSDGKKVTGVAHIPNSATAQNKKPVIVQFRGYVDKDKYFPGEETEPSAKVYAANGFISLAPDFLGYGGSDKSSTDAFEDRFLTYTTALNLLASVGTLSMADVAHVGIWGHSNGGQIALTVSEIIGRPIPVVLWAPVSAPFPYSILYYSDEADDHGKLLRKELADFEQNYDADLYSLTNYLNRVGGPVQVHQGTADDAVPVIWSDQFVQTLKSEGVSVQYFVYPGADHNMSGVWDTVVSRDVAFFQKNLK